MKVPNFDGIIIQLLCGSAGIECCHLISTNSEEIPAGRILLVCSLKDF